MKGGQVELLVCVLKYSANSATESDACASVPASPKETYRDKLLRPWIAPATLGAELSLSRLLLWLHAAVHCSLTAAWKLQPAICFSDRFRV